MFYQVIQAQDNFADFSQDIVYNADYLKLRKTKVDMKTVSSLDLTTVPEGSHIIEVISNTYYTFYEVPNADLQDYLNHLEV